MPQNNFLREMPPEQAKMDQQMDRKPRKTKQPSLTGIKNRRAQMSE
jgi:hypothetical protein